ncbi:MAG: N-acetylmuramoyl-L-alanine amidase [Candidatus Omnitrophica bacterium]|nr:N-acetylmuramoyl-L-alanine amidase [Candidatus Omnitrophota bacterium]
MRKSAKSPLLIVWVLHCLFFITLITAFSSCTTAPQPIPTYSSSSSRPKPAKNRRTLIHTIAPGETLWRLSKMYSVSMASILKANHIRKNDPLKIGQDIQIPHAAKLTHVISFFPSHKWRYIVIHHSASDEGSSLDIHYSHLNRGWDGAGYHFIIDNATRGKQDGQIETTPRWLKQRDGAHCKAADMNTKAIGICLIGNFSEDKVSRQQIDSLVYLVNELRDYYNIPQKNIMGHGQVPGAKTECPGKYFPWNKFKRKLQN